MPPLDTPRQRRPAVTLLGNPSPPLVRSIAADDPSPALRPRVRKAAAFKHGGDARGLQGGDQGRLLCLLAGRTAWGARAMVRNGRQWGPVGCYSSSCLCERAEEVLHVPASAAAVDLPLVYFASPPSASASRVHASGNPRRRRYEPRGGTSVCAWGGARRESGRRGARSGRNLRSSLSIVMRSRTEMPPAGRRSPEHNGAYSRAASQFFPLTSFEAVPAVHLCLGLVWLWSEDRTCIPVVWWNDGWNSTEEWGDV
ncbi:hypothetical protein CALVIDRAFT_135294 [Calocera viscosa TUFC12733]|uniref:Uncharacterized protein n=1 Tax=Calocera viscosa (strain TUFC12733) TaxID=1330018 RepID=A0A167LXR0_CALVF|nr:hypothetical protein CALVIDRAFT_135294 [Calocera viscosa TUFC12733]